MLCTRPLVPGLAASPSKGGGAQQACLQAKCHASRGARQQCHTLPLHTRTRHGGSTPRAKSQVVGCSCRPCVYTTAPFTLGHKCCPALVQVRVQPSAAPQTFSNGTDVLRGVKEVHVPSPRSWGALLGLGPSAWAWGFSLHPRA